MAPLYPKMSSSPATSIVSPAAVSGAGFEGVENSPISASSQDSIPTSLHLQDHLESVANSNSSTTTSVSSHKCIVCGNTAFSVDSADSSVSTQGQASLKVLSCRHAVCLPCIEESHAGSSDVSCPHCHQVSSLAHDPLQNSVTSNGHATPREFTPTSMFSPISATAALDVSTSSSASGVNASTSGCIIGSNGGMTVTQAGPASPYSPNAVNPNGPHCTGCKSKEHNAVARCFDCSNLLCPNCVMAHQFMHCFEGHRVVTLSGDGNGGTIGAGGSLDEVLLASLAATVNGGGQLASNSSTRMQHDSSSPSINHSQSGNSSHLMSSPTMDPTHLLNGIRAETSLAPGGPVAGHSNGQSSPSSSADSSLIMSPVPHGGGGGGGGGGKLFNCPRHKNEGLKYFCFSCDYPICKECVMVEHGKGHEYDLLSEVGGKELERIQSLVDEAKTKAQDLKGFVKSAEHACSRLQLQYHKAQNDVNETHTFYRSMLDERKLEALKELDSILNSRQVSFSTSAQRIQEASDKLFQTTDFVERLMKQASAGEVLLFKKTLTSRLCNLINFSNDVSLPTNQDIEFVSNFQAIQIAVRNTYGYIRQGCPGPESAHPPPGMMGGGGGKPGGMAGAAPGSAAGLPGHAHHHNPAALRPSPLAAAAAAHLALEQQQQQQQHGRAAADALAVATLSAAGAPPNFAGQMAGLEALASGQQNGVPNGNFGLSPAGLSPAGGPGLVGAGYEKWSSAGADLGIVNPGDLLQQLQAAGTTDPIIDLTSKLISANIYPPKSQIKRQKMIYHCKFGEFGVMEGQFTEPSGVAVNAQNDIVVADTNNHRIQIFDKEGRFKFQFGECGKRDGQLLYPNRVAVVKPSGDIIVTERSPTHQIQIYNQYGQFVRKFGANILQHPRGVTVDTKGRIIIVECKVMRVIIFDQMGNVLSKFGCSKHLEFPNGVVVNDRQEIFISDNRAHCVKVFNYEGQFLRQVGGEGITNYPIGVGINANGEILIADNHNNFNLTIFTQDGQLVNALESKVKHAQCFDVSLMDDGTIVLASKDYRIYLYRYIQLPGIGM